MVRASRRKVLVRGSDTVLGTHTPRSPQRRRANRSTSCAASPGDGEVDCGSALRATAHGGVRPDHRATRSRVQLSFSTASAAPRSVIVGSGVASVAGRSARRRARAARCGAGAARRGLLKVGLMRRVAPRDVGEQHARGGPRPDGGTGALAEHFNLGIPGVRGQLRHLTRDAAHSSPYAYVGPWTMREGPLGNASSARSARPTRCPTAEAVAGYFGAGAAAPT